ncbi:MAG TPA: hypothetical protein VJI33_04010 [Candidatus Paceibacterota bacterium]
MKKYQTGFALVIILIIVITILVIGSGIYVFTVKQKLSQNTSAQNQSNTIANIAISSRTYKNDEYGFEFRYPAEAKLSSAPANIPWYGKLSWGDGSVIDFEINNRGFFPRTNSDDACSFFNLSTKTIGGRKIEIIERNDCDNGEGIVSGLSAIIPIANNKELHIGIGEYNRVFSEKNKIRISSLILTFNFTK